MFKKLSAILLIVLIMSVSFYFVYKDFSLSKPAVSNNVASEKTFESSDTTVTDATGHTVTVPGNVSRIISLNGALTELLCVMGCQELIVGRTPDATFPPSILNVPIVGDSSYSPNVEKIFELSPDIIIADSMLAYNTELYDLLTGQGIPIFIVDDSTEKQPAKNPMQMTPAELHAMPTIVDDTCALMQNLTDIVGHKEQATAYIAWIQHYNTIVKDRIATLTREDQLTVFLDWYSKPYSTFISSYVYQCGGINIAENATSYSPKLSPEFVVEQNPSIIIELILSPNHDINDFIAAKNDILCRPDLQGVDAVKNGRVYICDFNAKSGLRAVIGYLYFAKWLQPNLFSDIDPEAVNQQINQQFFSVYTTGTYCY